MHIDPMESALELAALAELTNPEKAAEYFAIALHWERRQETGNG
jgi:hypothetical protein